MISAAPNSGGQSRAQLAISIDRTVSLDTASKEKYMEVPSRTLASYGEVDDGLPKV